MKRITIRLLFAIALLLALGTLAPIAEAADSARISATLILGGNSGAGVDSQLQRYERHLKRVAPFDSFTHQGSGNASIAVPGAGEIRIGRQHSVTLQVSDAESGKLRIAAKWTSAGRTLINTTIVASKDQPTVLGGPSSNGGNLILLLVAR